MGYTKVFQNNRYQSHYVKFVADTAEDVKKLRVANLTMGSEVYVIQEKRTYVLGSDEIWYSKAVNDDVVIECDCVEESTIWEDLPDPKN
jgi:hypothetical protein